MAIRARMIRKLEIFRKGKSLYSSNEMLRASVGITGKLARAASQHRALGQIL